MSNSCSGKLVAHLPSLVMVQDHLYSCPLDSLQVAYDVLKPQSGHSDSCHAHKA